MRSYEIIGFLGTPVVHNEIVFKTPGGETVLNGDAWNRDKGQRLGISTSGRDTLRVSEGHSADTAPNHQYPNLKKVAEMVLWQVEDGPDEDTHKRNWIEFTKLKIKATEAALFINSQDLDYVPISWLVGHGQNSNSVASSIVRAMGLKVPPEIENLWAPGAERILLPNKNWKSAIDVWQQPEDINEVYYALTRHQNYIASKLSLWQKEGVQGTILSESGQSAHPTIMTDEGHALYQPVFFDPNNPKPFFLPVVSNTETITVQVHPIATTTAKP